LIRPLRFARGYLRNRPAHSTSEVVVPTSAGPVGATLHLPPGPGPFPGWVILHGLSVRGRHHPALLRFVSSMVASGGGVLVPEVVSWQRLRIAAADSHEILVGAVGYLSRRSEIRPGGVGLVGFSFGSTQALVAAADQRIAGQVRTCVGFGGYADMGRTMRYFTDGRHAWSEVEHQDVPDPYGRWVAALNYLTHVPGLEGMGRVVAGLERLATHSGERMALLEPDQYRELQGAIGTSLGAEERRIWELVAPPEEQEVVRDPAGVELAQRIAETALRHEPLIDPRAALPSLRCRVVLAHGMGDRLIPFTETLRLGSLLPSHLDATVRITGLFAHSRGASLPLIRYLGEGVAFLRLLRAALR
jgi:pimeloyl-ACP methyl ester carboxylesterase